MKVFERWSRWEVAVAELRERLPPEAVDLLTEAYRFAERRHGSQSRPAGEPYVQHLLEVLEILATHLDVTDPDLLAAGLLHDVVEDTDATLAQVAERFGERTAELVDAVTMRTGGTDRNRPSESAPSADGPGEQEPEPDRSSLRRSYLAALRNAPSEVLRLKLADRYSNVQRLHTHPRAHKQRSYYSETVAHFVPLSAVDDRLAGLFADWMRAYSYLAAAPAPSHPT